LNGEIKPELASLGYVTLDGRSVPFDATNGWKVIDGKNIELVGTACQTVQSAGTHSLFATFPCDVVITLPQ
jgi:hypothetical protein